MIKLIEENRPELYRVYSFDEIQKVCPGSINSTSIGEFPIPTQVIIGIGETNPRTPMMGRIWKTKFYQRDEYSNHLYTYEELQNNFKSTGSHNEVIVTETYGDWGCDGHVEYCLMDYKVILLKDYHKALKEISDTSCKNYWGLLHDVFRGTSGDKYDWVYSKICDKVIFQRVEDGDDYRNNQKEENNQ